MKAIVRYIGMDVHKDTICVAVADGGRGRAEVLETIPNNWLAVMKLLDRVGPPARLRVCYEAGPTGFELARCLSDQGICCVVAAPSLIPRQPGCRVKTDRRDAVQLARFLRSGDLVEVAIPDRQSEAMRDLERSRDDAKRAERVARHQLDKFLLRHNRIWSGKTKWTQAHRRWINEQSFAEAAQRRVLDDYIATVDGTTARVDCLTVSLEELVDGWALGPLVRALMALRGVGLVTAVTLVAEIGDFGRFTAPGKLMSFIGLVPSIQASGLSCRHGRITRSGNGHVRRVLVEAAWNYRFRPRGTSAAIAARRSQVSPAVRRIAEQAEQRLCRRYRQLTDKGKAPQKVVIAVARELAGFVWAIAQQENLLAV